MYPDFKELLALLNNHKVKYLVIGGYAVAVHAQPRVTNAAHRDATSRQKTSRINTSGSRLAYNLSPWTSSRKYPA